MSDDNMNALFAAFGQKAPASASPASLKQAQDRKAANADFFKAQELKKTDYQAALLKMQEGLTKYQNVDQK